MQAWVPQPSSDRELPCICLLSRFGNTKETVPAAARSTDEGLARRPGRALSRQRLVKHVWGFEFLGESRLVDLAVKRLRDKLGDDARESRYITTVRGGYRFEAGRRRATADHR